MSARALLGALALLLLPSLAAHADPLEAIKPLRCALVGASECNTTATCNDVQLEQIGIPDVMRVDFAAKVLGSPDTERTSPIHSVETFEEALVLQGSQNGRGWTIVIERASGHLSATVADVEGSFVLYGGCIGE